VTAVPPTQTPIPPTATSTPIPPTVTAVPPTQTPIPPTATIVPPTQTPIPITDFGPVTGQLIAVNGEKGLIFRSHTNNADAVMSATFTAPIGEWSRGFQFRTNGNDSYEFVITHTKAWHLNLHLDGKTQRITSGLYPGIKTILGQKNDMKLMAMYSHAWLFINGTFIDIVYIGEHTSVGDVLAVGQVYGEAISTGLGTDIYEFEIKSVSNYEIESHGSIPHDPISDYMPEGGSVKGIYNFIAMAEIDNPYPASRGTWEVGISFRAIGEEYSAIIIQENGCFIVIGGSPSSGCSPHINTAANESNTFYLLFDDDVGLIFVNAVRLPIVVPATSYQKSIALSEPDRLEISILGGFYRESQFEGESVDYRKYYVWDLGHSSDE